jgi:hypothetical protein
MTTTMRSKNVAATFTGLDGSCGFKKGKEYRLTLRHKKGDNICIEEDGGGGWCEYNSIVSFLENWDRVSVVVSTY